MRRWIGVVSGALILGAIGAPALAQRPKIPPGPVDPNYKTPRFDADFTRKMAELPDWNGSYATVGELMFDPDHMVLNPDQAQDEAFSTGPLEGSYLTGIPYKPEYQKLYDKRIADSLKGEISDPVGGCRQPHGMPRQMGASPGGPEIIVLPSQVRMTWYWFNATRRIFTDGRKHPTGDDLVPSFMGHSIGHWEGDTLVVDTVGMHAGIYDRSEAPHSDQIHVMERMRMVAPDRLEVKIVIEDPVMLTKPWSVTHNFLRRTHTPQAEGAYCEGGRIEMENGVQKMVLPDEKAGSDRFGPRP